MGDTREGLHSIPIVQITLKTLLKSQRHLGSVLLLQYPTISSSLGLDRGW